MSMDYLDDKTPMINGHGCYDDDDEEDNKADDNLDDDDDDDNSSTRNTAASTCTSTRQLHQQQRRLTNSKVREIFECLYQFNGSSTNGNTASSPPKIPIPFTIVPVNSNGKALSPPSYEFECT